MLNSGERGLAVVLFNLIFTTVLAATPGEQYPCAPTLCPFLWENLTFLRQELSPVGAGVWASPVQGVSQSILLYRYSEVS